MTPAAIIEMITAIANAAAELAKLAQTTQGQALIQEGIENRVLAKQWFEEAGAWIRAEWAKLKLLEEAPL